MPQLILWHWRHVGMSVAATAPVIDVAAAHSPCRDDLFDGVEIVIGINPEFAIAGGGTCEGIDHNRTPSRLPISSAVLTPDCPGPAGVFPSVPRGLQILPQESHLRRARRRSN